MKVGTLKVGLVVAAGSFIAVGCGNKPKTAAANGSVTEIRAVTPTAPVVAPQPVVVQPVQPVQPIVSDTPPTSSQVASATPTITGNSYTVQKGDTLSKIARAKYGDVSGVRKIKDANPGIDANN